MPRTQVTGREPLPVPAGDNLTTTLWRQAARGGDKQILQSYVDGRWTGPTWSELAERVTAVAAGLMAVGVGRGDRVALMASTRLEWTVADLAILAAGGVSVPIYDTSSVEQCAWILSDSGASVAIAGSGEHAKQLDLARGAGGTPASPRGAGGTPASPRADAPALGEVFVIDDAGLDAIADRAGDAERAAVAERAASVGLEDLATIIYTSGTTGNPKGCLLTHGNLLRTARQSKLYLGELFQPTDSTLLFLPLAHSFARIIQFGCLENDVRVGYARSIDKLGEDLVSFQPTFLLSVPRVFEKVFNTAQRKAEGPKRRVFDFAVATAQAYATTSRPGTLLKVQHAVVDKLVYAKLRDAVGGRIRYCVSGGAPLADHIAHFFHAAGITILEGYGLTETSAATVCNTPDGMRIGTVGKPIPGVEVRIADDGEILLRGAGVFAGYHRNETATREVLDDDGWFATGDIGSIDDDGFVKITGRKKEIIVTAGGKNVAPAVLEERIKSHRLVSQAMVIGDNKPYVAALVTLDPDEAALFSSEHGLPADPAALAKDPAVLAEVQHAIDHANQAVSKAESIRRFVVAPRDFTMEDDELTPSLKLKRARVAEHFADELASLYS